MTGQIRAGSRNIGRVLEKGDLPDKGRSQERLTGKRDRKAGYQLRDVLSGLDGGCRLLYTDPRGEGARHNSKL